MKKIFTGILASVALVAAFVSCSSVKSGIHADVIGFNDEVYTYYEFYDLGAEKARKNDGKESKLEALIYNIPDGKNTAEYYAMDIALDRIAEVASDADENSRASYYLILLTDGLDNVSVEMAKRNGKGKYLNDEEYAMALKKRMDTILDTKKGRSNSRNVFQSYPLMIFGNDLQESGLTEEDCKEILKNLAGAQNSFIPDPIVNSSTEKIVEAFKDTFAVTSFTFEVPKGFVGKGIQMSFDLGGGNKVDVVADFECQTKKKKETYILKNISCSDEKFNFEQKDMSQVVADEDYEGSENLVSFTFSNIKYNKRPKSVMGASQSYMLNGKYVKNSEYNAESKSKTDSYILFVLDTSSSLGKAGRKSANKTAVEIIEHIQSQIQK